MTRVIVNLTICKGIYTIKITPMSSKDTVINGFTFRTFEPAPDGFNPVTAEQDKLALYGIPERPDKDKEPALYNNWHRIFSRKLQYLEPQFAKFDRLGPRKLPDITEQPEFGTVNSGIWSGQAVGSPSGDTFNTVTGWWIVPRVFSSNTVGECILGSWIGIDGYASSKIKQAGDVLQAGTASISNYALNDGSDGNGIPAYYAWVEWWPNGPITVLNLPISGGDSIACFVVATSDTMGSVVFINFNSNLVVPFQIVAPSGHSLVGNSAEWIIERQAAFNFPPVYVPAPFIACYATTKKGITIQSSSGDTLNIKVGSSVLAKTVKLNNESFVIFQPES